MAVSTNPTISLSTDPPWVIWWKHGCACQVNGLYAKQISYTKSQYNSLYLTIVGLFDVYVVFSQCTSKQVVDYFTLGVEKVYFLFTVYFPFLLQLQNISTECAQSICWWTGDRNLQVLRVSIRWGCPYQLTLRINKPSLPLQDMYRSNKTQAVKQKGETEYFPIEVGLHKWSALSPLLFI